VTDVDVYAPTDGLIVGFGDSITVGYNASDEGWPYWLADRLVQLAADGGPRLSIIDMGISGNQVTQNTGAGQSAENRLQRDVLDQAGLRGVLMMEGINDIGNFGQAAVRRHRLNP
jgi:lysophospholipase L1-like esterase